MNSSVANGAQHHCIFQLNVTRFVLRGVVLCGVVGDCMCMCI